MKYYGSIVYKLRQLLCHVRLDRLYRHEGKLKKCSLVSYYLYYMTDLCHKMLDRLLGRVNKIQFLLVVLTRLAKFPAG